jgi:Xaa-Pro dipeptidase
LLLNLDRAYDIMEKHNIDALIATTPENVAYLSDYGEPGTRPVNRLSPSYAVISRKPDCAPLLLVPVINLCFLAQHPTWITDVRAFGRFFVEIDWDKSLPDAADLDCFRQLLRQVPQDPTPIEALVKALTERGLNRGCLGLDEAGILPSVYDALKSVLPEARILPSYNIFREIRAVKTSAEVARMRRVTTVTCGAIEHTFNSIRPGVTERDIALNYHSQVAAAGAFPRHSAWGCGLGSAWPFTLPSDYVMKAGDLVRCDVGCQLDFYWSGVSRTAVLGKPRRDYLHYYRAVRQAQVAALDKIRVGAKAADIFDIAVETARREGIPHYRRPHVGHGIGLEGYDEPLIAPDSPWVLEAGMILNIEPPYYEIGLGGFTVEDTIVVTEQGFEFLSNLDRELCEL